MKNLFKHALSLLTCLSLFSGLLHPLNQEFVNHLHVIENQTCNLSTFPDNDDDDDTKNLPLQ